MRNKLTSRKFWISIAAFLGSIGMSISGVVTGEKWVTVVGTVCAMLSAAIYAAVEAYCDANIDDDDRTHLAEVTHETNVNGGLTSHYIYTLDETETKTVTPEASDKSSQE